MSWIAEKSDLYLYVYVAGPMRNYPAYNFPAFMEAESDVYPWSREAYGKPAVVFNPAQNDIHRHRLEHMSPQQAGQWLMDHPEEAGFDLRVALGEDLAWISEFADVVVVIPGWRASKGATAEVALARALGLPVVEYLPALTDLPARFREVPPSEYDVEIGGERFTSQQWEAVQTYARGPRPEMHTDEEWAALKESRKPDGLVSGLLARGESVPVTEYAADGSVREYELVGGTPEYETRTTSSTGGQKGVKLARFDLIPTGPLTALAEHYGRGALKYDSHQWRNGYEWSKSYAAKQRHDNAFWGGEDYDVCPPDRRGCRETDLDGNPFVGETEHGRTCFNHTGSHHLAASAWHAFCLLEFAETHPEHDDRYKGE